MFNFLSDLSKNHTISPCTIMSEVNMINSNSHPPEKTALTTADRDRVPDNLPILPAERQVAFPGLNMTPAINLDSLTPIEKAMQENQIIGIVGVNDQQDWQTKPDWVRKAGTAVKILYVTRAVDNNVVWVVHGLKRFRIVRWLPPEPYPQAQVEIAPEIAQADVETEALHRRLRDLSGEVFSMSLEAPKEATQELGNVKNPLGSAYIAAAHADIDFDKRQNLLEEDNLKIKLRDLVALLSREKEIL
jgi:ATP-dependent Lon protease